MNEDTGVEYLTPWVINGTIDGLGGIGKITKIHGKKSTHLIFQHFQKKKKSFFPFRRCEMWLGNR